MKPRYIRIYDNGGATADRYTVVYTRKSITTPTMRWYPYVGMSANPYHPQGVCTHDDQGGQPIDRPTSSHLGRKITWADLPEDCQTVVLGDYAELWNNKGPMLA